MFASQNLHTLLLGICKYGNNLMHKELRQEVKKNKESLAIFAAWVSDVNCEDCRDTISTSSILEIGCKFVGREYKIMTQYGLYPFSGVVTVPVNHRGCCWDHCS
jgi:hypothetical protein